MADLRRLIPHQWKEHKAMGNFWWSIKVWLRDRGFDNATVKEGFFIMLLACSVWAVLAAIYYVATFGVW